MGGVTDFLFGSDAPQEAAQVQAGATQAGIAEQRRQFDILQQQLEPARFLGLQALRQQASLAGIDVPEQVFAGFGAPAAQAVPTAPVGGSAIARGLQGLVEANRAQQVATQAPGEQITLPAIAAAQPRAALGEGFELTPGQQFLQQQAERALLRNAAATGQLGGGATQQALQEQAIGLGQQFLTEQEQLQRQREIDEFNRLAAISGTGQQAQSQLGAAGQQTASNIAGLQQQLGNIQAQGILGTAQSQQTAFGNLVGLGASAGLGAAGAFGGAGGLSGAGLGAGLALLSDHWSKKNIKRIGIFKDVGLYDYDYLDGTHRIGVMAHEVKAKYPEMVVHRNGYNMVRLEFYG